MRADDEDEGLGWAGRRRAQRASRGWLEKASGEVVEARGTSSGLEEEREDVRDEFILMAFGLYAS